jgi:hypothetical protein
LNVTQKRRIYDITNVLEGIGLIEKRSKNVIYWKYILRIKTGLILSFRGGKFRKPGGTVEVLPGEEQRIYKLKSDLTELEREERLIDTHLRWMKQVSGGQTIIIKTNYSDLEHKKYLRRSRQFQTGLQHAC